MVYDGSKLREYKRLGMNDVTSQDPHDRSPHHFVICRSRMKQSKWNTHDIMLKFVGFRGRDGCKS